MKSKPNRDFLNSKKMAINNHMNKMKGDNSIPESFAPSTQMSKLEIKAGLSVSNEEDAKNPLNLVGDGGVDETPRTQIYNQILYNIKQGIFDTKIEYYKIGKVIGKGAFGKVNLAIHRLTSQFVALKSINKTFMSDEASHKKVIQEYKILKRVRHPNIVRLYESFENDSHIVYVMEVCGGGDLLTYVRRRRKLKEDIAKFLFKQII